MWDAQNKRQKHIDPYAYYTFNFYGEYSRDVFLNAHIDDPELEAKVKKIIEGKIWCTENSDKYIGGASHVYMYLVVFFNNTPQRHVKCDKQ